MGEKGVGRVNEWQQEQHKKIIRDLAEEIMYKEQIDKEGE
jgi:hypothetical protein